MTTQDDDPNRNPANDDAARAAQSGNQAQPPAGYGATPGGGASFTDDISFVDELNVRDLRQPLRDSRGRQFSAAGRNTPVAEFTDDFLVLHPPQKPFQDADAGPSEDIMLMMDEFGVLVDHWGERRNIPGAKFNGRALFYFYEQKPGTLKHYAVYFDDEQQHHFLAVEGERITVDVVYKLRNMTHDGELTRFKELTPE